MACCFALMVRSMGSMRPGHGPDLGSYTVACIASAPLIAAALAAFIVDVFRKDGVRGDAKAVWTALVLVGYPVVPPIYWFLYIVRRPDAAFTFAPMDRASASPVRRPAPEPGPLAGVLVTAVSIVPFLGWARAQWWALRFFPRMMDAPGSVPSFPTAIFLSTFLAGAVALVIATYLSWHALSSPRVRADWRIAWVVSLVFGCLFAQPVYCYRYFVRRVTDGPPA
jgi:hypothetical protein